MLIVWDTPVMASVDDVVKEMRQELKLQGSSLLKHYRDVGSDLMLSCISHKGGMERNPSMGISKYDVERGGRIYPAGTVHCFTCGYTADLPKFVADTFGFDNPTVGYKWIVERFIYGADGSRGELTLHLGREHKERKVVSEEDIEEWHKALFINTEALDWLTKTRRIPLQVLTLFKVGYRDGRIVFPVRNRFGEVVLLKERTVASRDFHNTKDAEKRFLLYGIEHVRMDGKPYFVVEGEIDCLSVYGFGRKSVALMGSHFSEEQAVELRRAGAEKLVLALDNDTPGREGTKEAKELLLPLGFRLHYFPFPLTIKDMNDLTLKDFEELLKEIRL